MHLQCVLQHEWGKCVGKIIDNNKGRRSVESCKTKKNEKNRKRKIYGRNFCKTTRITRGIGKIGQSTNVKVVLLIVISLLESPSSLSVRREKGLKQGLV